MATHYLDKLFHPSSIAVIGASDRLNSVGMRVFKNLIQNGFLGKLYPVNPKHKSIHNHLCYASVADIKEPIDLAVITIPSNNIPPVIAECGKKGIKIAIVISSGFSETGEEGKRLEKELLDSAEKNHIRLIGPNCLGVMCPHIKMNATFDNGFAIPGNLAFVSQSGALSAGILDWSMKKEVGFSAMVSLGNSADIDFADILDYLATDPETESILLYIEGIHHARSFMSALRAAARMKPIIAIKAGRHQLGSRAAISHTGALIGNDDVFDIALHRAGAVRVITIEDLFLAAEILSSNYRVKGNRLMIITNGGGVGVMAADCAQDLKIELPELNKTTINALDKVLPTQWSHQNPIDIIGDANPSRYHSTMDICLKDQNIDGILTILVPVAMTEPYKVAAEIVTIAKQNEKPILACWMGEKQVKSSWDLFAKNKIPYFDTPENAVKAFSYLAAYQHNQELLLQAPEPFSPQPTPNLDQAQVIVQSVIKDHRTLLTIVESKNLLKAFAIPVSETIEARNVDEALKAAVSLGFPVAVKIHSPDITHKKDVGGVMLHVTDPNALEQAFDKIIKNAQKHCPDAKILGVTVEPMFKHPHDRELMIGVIRDVVFGPVISFGAGGTFVEIMKDRALALPPLNRFIAKQLISETKISKTLGNFRNMPAVDLEMIVNILLRVSEMVCEIPYIKEMDINPLIVSEKGAEVVDARIVIDDQFKSHNHYTHMAIHPYPNDLISTINLPNETDIKIRPIRPEDALMVQNFVRHLSTQSKYFRFMHHIRELTPSMLVRLTQIDYDREMTFIATHDIDVNETAVGLAHYVTNPDRTSCEFAIVVADDWQNKRIGSTLMNALTADAKEKHLEVMMGVVLATNTNMLDLTQRLGFTVSSSDDPTVKMVTRYL